MFETLDVVLAWAMGVFTWILVFLFAALAAGSGDGPLRPARPLLVILAVALAWVWFASPAWSPPVSAFVGLVFAWIPFVLLRRTHVAMRVENTARARTLARRSSLCVPNSFASMIDVLDQSTQHLLEGKSELGLELLDSLSSDTRESLRKQAPLALGIAQGEFESTRDNCLDLLTSNPRDTASLAFALEAMLWIPDADGIVGTISDHHGVLMAAGARWSGALDTSRLALSCACGLEEDAERCADELPLTTVDRELVRMRSALGCGEKVEPQRLDELRSMATPMQRWQIRQLASLEPCRTSDETAQAARELLAKTRSSWTHASGRTLNALDWVWGGALVLVCVLSTVEAVFFSGT